MIRHNTAVTRATLARVLPPEDVDDGVAMCEPRVLRGAALIDLVFRDLVTTRYRAEVVVLADGTRAVTRVKRVTP